MKINRFSSSALLYLRIALIFVLLYALTLLGSTVLYLHTPTPLRFDWNLEAIKGVFLSLGFVFPTAALITKLYP